MTTMTKPQRKLLWNLFLILREIMPTNEAGNRRVAEWARKFQDLDRKLEAEEASTNA